MICDNCGHSIQDNAIYCNYCGVRQKIVRKKQSADKNPILVSAPFYADKYEMKADLDSHPQNWTRHTVNPVAVFLYLLAAVYLALEVYSIIQLGMTDAEEIINYLFLNLLIPLGLVAAASIIQLLSGIRSYLETLADGNRIKGVISVSEKSKDGRSDAEER